MTFRAGLRDHHARLLTIASEADEMLCQSSSAISVAAFAALRGGMLEELGAYQGFVHREVFEEAKRIDDAARTMHAEELKAVCIGLSLEYQSFVIRWAHRSAMENWAEYRLSANKMVTAVREHVRDCPWPAAK